MHRHRAKTCALALLICLFAPSAGWTQGARALALAGQAAPAAAGRATADLAAKVNGKNITMAQLDKQSQARMNGAEQPPSLEAQQDLKLQVLHQMINDQIL